MSWAPDQFDLTIPLPGDCEDERFCPAPMRQSTRETCSNAPGYLIDDQHVWKATSEEDRYYVYCVNCGRRDA